MQRNFLNLKVKFSFVRITRTQFMMQMMMTIQPTCLIVKSLHLSPQEASLIPVFIRYTLYIQVKLSFMLNYYRILSKIKIISEAQRQ